MPRPSPKQRKTTNRLIFIVGLFLILIGLFFLFFSHLEQSHYERWKAAAVIREVGELRTLQGRDVALVATIDPQTPTEEHGLALYEYWEHQTHYKDGEREEEWEHISALDYKPAVNLLLYEQPIVVRSQDASLQKTTTVRQNNDVKLKGLSPGQAVTLLGQVSSPQDPPTVEADIICGGSRQSCLKQFAQQSTILRVIGLGLLAIGIGLFATNFTN